MSTPTESRRPPRRGDIQGLRALAVGLVILAHAGIGQFPGGFVGVDVFFVLSGFLITGLLVAEADRTGRVSIAGFYARRARRILPAATVTLLAILLWTVLREPFTAFASVAKDSLWSAVFLSNVHFAGINTDYFSDTAVSPVRHFWSLSVEEQFYVVWPLLVLLLLVLKARRRVLVVVMAGVVLASLAWSVHLTGTDPQAAYFSTPARAHELGLGALLALCTPMLANLPTWLRHVLAVTGLGLIAVATFGFSEATPFPSWRALVPVLGTVALLAAGTGREVGLSTLLGRQPLRYLGDLSFSLYLWHWPVLVLGRPHLAQYEWGFWPETIVLLLITFVVSALSYHLVEQPFQKGTLPSLRGLRYLVLWPVSLALVAVTAFGANLYGEHRRDRAAAEAAAYYEKNPEALVENDPTRVPEQIRAALDLADAGAPLPTERLKGKTLHFGMRSEGRNCFADFPETSHPLCSIGSPKSSRTMVLLGDSHAGMWMPAMRQIAQQADYRLVPLLKMGCAPYDVPQHLQDGSAYPECDEFRDWSAEQLAELEPDVLVVAHRGMLFMDGGSLENQEQLWRDGTRSSLQRYVDTVPDVLVLADVPAIGSTLKACLGDADSTLSDCVAPRTGLEIDADVLTKASALEVGARWVDTGPLICADQRCPLLVGTTVTYRDNSHVSQRWVKNVAAALGRRLDLPPAEASASHP